jgi:hypothetical protein
MSEVDQGAARRIRESLGGREAESIAASGETQASKRGNRKGM